MALSDVLIEDGLALEAEIAGPQADDFSPAPSGQDEGQQDRPVASPGHRFRNHREEPAHLVGGVSPRGGS